MKIIRITAENYNQFDAMIYWRINGKERSKDSVNNRITKEIRVELENNNLNIFSAIVEGKMVGWISLIYMPKVGRFNGKGHVYVDELWVEPIYRSKGIAHELMKKADELKEKISAAGIRLYVSQDNLSAKKLYEKCGYLYSGETYFMEKIE